MLTYQPKITFGDVRASWSIIAGTTNAATTSDCADRWPDHLRPSDTSDFVCTTCGKRGAEFRREFLLLKPCFQMPGSAAPNFPLFVHSSAAGRSMVFYQGAGNGTTAARLRTRGQAFPLGYVRDAAASDCKGPSAQGDRADARAWFVASYLSILFRSIIGPFGRRCTRKRYS